MIERPLLLRGPQVRAFREGRQTQDRRPIKFPQSAFIPDTSWIKSIHQDGGGNWIAWGPDNPDGLKEFTKKAYPNGEGFPCPFGREGDRLWIRETWQAFSPTDLEWSSHKPAERAAYKPEDWRVFYRADNPDVPEWMGWNPSIHMPRWASRLTLEIERVRVEQIQDIAPDDAIAEGYPFPRDEAFPYPVDWFLSLWDSLYAKTYPWASNPWIWVMDLKVVDTAPKS